MKWINLSVPRCLLCTSLHVLVFSCSPWRSLTGNVYLPVCTALRYKTYGNSGSPNDELFSSSSRISEPALDLEKGNEMDKKSGIRPHYYFQLSSNKPLFLVGLRSKDQRQTLSDLLGITLLNWWVCINWLCILKSRLTLSNHINTFSPWQLSPSWYSGLPMVHPLVF